MYQIPAGGVSELPVNHEANGSKSFLLSTTRQCVMTGDGREHGAVEYLCVDCLDGLCATCREAHRYTKPTRDHVTKLIRELSAADVAQHRNKAALQCAFHPSHDVEVYCRLVANQCVILYITYRWACQTCL